MRGVDISLAGGWIEVACIVHPPGEVVISMRPVSVFAKGPAGEIEKLEAGLHGRWRQATRAVMVLLSLHGLAPSQIAELLDCHPAAAGPGWADAGWPGGSPRCSGARARGPCRESGSTWAGRRSARGRCTGGSGWWRYGGGPSWPPAATRT